MSMQDPISDMLTRIRNGLLSKKISVMMPFSSNKQSIAKVLFDEGYIDKYLFSYNENNHKILEVILKYYNGSPVIDFLKRVSRPGLRVYKKHDDLPIIKGGLGIAIVSTSQGLLTAHKARARGIGGEIICFVS